MLMALISCAVLFALAALVVCVLMFLSASRRSHDFEAGLASLEKSQERSASVLKEELSRSRTEAGQNDQRARQELAQSLSSSSDSLLSRMTEIATLQRNQLETFSNQLAALTRTNEQKIEAMRETVEKKLQALREDNSRKLEQMRATVDEKLHATLEKRLGESFKLVGERLEQVYRGLGEMQTLAAGVGDLKKVLTNVKTRGTWGEMSLGFLLEQLFTPEQFSRNVATKKGSSERVEFALRLPGRGPDEAEVWLPIDAKFPEADYRRLVEAQEQASPERIEEFSKSIERFIRQEARKIQEKYIDPPYTTDFGIMFLPVESLYAEVLRRPGLCETLQRDFRIVVTGPTTLAALLNSLQMGFRTLAIERRSSEVWTLLGAVKTEFGKFGDLLDKTHKKLQEAGNTIETAARKSRTIERKLRGVQELPARESAAMIGRADDSNDDN